VGVGLYVLIIIFSYDFRFTDNVQDRTKAHAPERVADVNKR